MGDHELLRILRRLSFSRFFLAWLCLFFVIEVFQSAQAFTCTGLLRKLFSSAAWSSVESENAQSLRERFLRAEVSSKTAIGAQALAQLLILNQTQLGLSRKALAALKIIKRQTAEQVFEKPSARLGALAARTLRDTLWGSGPFFMRGLFQTSEEKLRSGLKELVQLFSDEQRSQTLQILQLNDSAFIELVVKAHFSTYQPLVSSVHRDALFRTYRATMAALVLSILGIHPAYLLENWGSAKLLAASKGDQMLLTATSFLNTAQKEVHIFDKNAQILVAMDKNFIRMARKSTPGLERFIALEDPARSISEIAILKGLYPQLQTRTFASASELDKLLQAEGKQYDTVMIIFHGLGLRDEGFIDLGVTRGEIVIGSQALGPQIENFHPGTLKAGAKLVFFSCHAGDKNSKKIRDADEIWVRFAMRLAGDQPVTALAPINNVLATLLFREDLTPEQRREMMRELDKDRPTPINDFRDWLSKALEESAPPKREALFQLVLTQIGNFGVALSMEGTGIAHAMSARKAAKAVALPAYSQTTGIRIFQRGQAIHFVHASPIDESEIEGLQIFRPIPPLSLLEPQPAPSHQTPPLPGATLHFPIEPPNPDPNFDITRPWDDFDTTRPWNESSLLKSPDSLAK